MNFLLESDLNLVKSIAENKVVFISNFREKVQKNGKDLQKDFEFKDQNFLKTLELKPYGNTLLLLKTTSNEKV